MEIVALITVFFFEISFAICRIFSKSDLAKIRSIARISFFIVFTILILTSIVQWGLRWYTFTGLLLIWAILGAVTLLRKNHCNPVYRTSQVLGNAAAMIFFGAIALVPALLFPQYTPLQPTGNYEVETLVDTYIDFNRVETYSKKIENRKITVQYWYPKNADATYPLVLFSHGSFGLRTSNKSLYRELASHGYVVCAIDHPYQSIFSTDTDGSTTFLDSGFMREVSSEDAGTDQQQSYEYYQKWMDIRGGDINFVIDTILARTNSAASDAVFKLVDPSKIGLMGHSLGGSAVLYVGRLRKDIAAVMALEAPFMGDIVGVENGKFIWNEKTYPTPVLNIYSDSSWSHLGEWPQYAANERLLSGENAKAYNVYLRGAGHLTLTDLALTSPFFTKILSGHPANTDAKYYLTVINQLTLDFFDCHLKNKGHFNPQAQY